MYFLYVLKECSSFFWAYDSEGREAAVETIRRSNFSYVAYGNSYSHALFSCTTQSSWHINNLVAGEILESGPNEYTVSKGYLISHVSIMVRTALFAIGKIKIQWRCPLSDKLRNCGVYINNRILYKHEKYKILSFAGKWVAIEDIIMKEISYTQNGKCCMFFLVCRKGKNNTNKRPETQHSDYYSRSGGTGRIKEVWIKK